jgi:hypothetical protein
VVYADTRDHTGRAVGRGLRASGRGYRRRFSSAVSLSASSLRCSAPLDYPLNLSPIIVRKVNVYGVVLTKVSFDALAYLAVHALAFDQLIVLILADPLLTNVCHAVTPCCA